MIKFLSIYRQDKKIVSKIVKDITRIIKKNNFINGKDVSKFESEFSKYCGTRYAVGCNSGSDALFLALKALDLKKGSEVILPAQTYVSTIFAVIRSGLKPILIDIQKDNPTLSVHELKKKISKKTSAIIAVHLYGECADIKNIKKIIQNKKIFLIEDAAQAHGAFDYSFGSKGKRAGSLGDIGCFSFYPGKNLGAYGDGGAITTNIKKYYLKLKKLRNLGGIKKYQHDIIGFNSRLDTIQASILLNKLKLLDKNNKKRLKIAKFYKNNISTKKVEKLNYSRGCVYHQYVIISKFEKKLIKIFNKNNIQYGKHYPEPLNKIKSLKRMFLKKKFINAERFSKFGISLPIDPNLKLNELKKICNLINSI